MRRAKQLLRYKYQKGDYGVSSVDKYVLLCKESRLCNAKNLRNCMTAALAGVAVPHQPDFRFGQQAAAGSHLHLLHQVLPYQ